jgi:hypothetical protein
MGLGGYHLWRRYAQPFEEFLPAGAVAFVDVHEDLYNLTLRQVEFACPLANVIPLLWIETNAHD